MPFAMQQLIAAAVTLSASAPPALLSLRRTSAAVPELLFVITAAACKRTERPTHRCKRPQPGKLVHHLASTRQRVLPGTPRRAANAIRQTRRVSIMRNPHVWKKAVGIDTRILRAYRRATESFAHESQPTPPPRPRSRPRAAPRRHHCRARGPEGHRRQDVGV